MRLSCTGECSSRVFVSSLSRKDHKGTEYNYHRSIEALRVIVLPPGIRSAPLFLLAGDLPNQPPGPHGAPPVSKNFFAYPLNEVCTRSGYSSFASSAPSFFAFASEFSPRKWMLIMYSENVHAARYVYSLVSAYFALFSAARFSNASLSSYTKGPSAIQGGGRTWKTHRDAPRAQRLCLPARCLRDLARLAKGQLVFPDDHVLVRGSRVPDDARDPRPDVIYVCEQHRFVVRGVVIVREGAEHCGRSRRSGNRELGPPPDVDEGVRGATVRRGSELLKVPSDLKFLVQTPSAWRTQ